MRNGCDGRVADLEGESGNSSHSLHEPLDKIVNFDVENFGREHCAIFVDCSQEGGGGGGGGEQREGEMS